MKEMNGVLPFVYIATCGDVFSQAGLKALAGSGNASTPPSDSQEEGNAATGQQLEVCPQCGAKYDSKTDLRMINPDKETEDIMRVAMEARRKEKSAKKTKKRKADETEANIKFKEVTEAKKARPAPSLNPTIAAASRAVTDSLAAEEAKRKAGMSDAVRSLYESKGSSHKETFMTRTFNRVSFSLPVFSSPLHSADSFYSVCITVIWCFLDVYLYPCIPVTSAQTPFFIPYTHTQVPSLESFRDAASSANRRRRSDFQRSGDCYVICNLIYI